MEEDRRLLTRIVIRNYKSIAACDVSPAQLTFLVGPNGSGKSNFLDALRFVADSLRFSIDHALRDRYGGGPAGVPHTSGFALSSTLGSRRAISRSTSERNRGAGTKSCKRSAG